MKISLSMMVHRNIKRELFEQFKYYEICYEDTSTYEDELCVVFYPSYKYKMKLVYKISTEPSISASRKEKYPILYFIPINKSEIGELVFDINEYVVTHFEIDEE